jgi:hypothetical protein
MKALPITIAFVLAAALWFAATGCERPSNPPPPPKPTTAVVASSGLPASLWLTSAPADAKPVVEVKTSAALGQDVVLSGRIGGGKDPFVVGRAMFMLADPTLPSCIERHGPGCPTPWDYCCEPKETVLASTATVQVVDSDGKPLKVGLENEHGLKPLAAVVIAGKVSSVGDSVVINATGIYVKP